LVAGAHNNELQRTRSAPVTDAAALAAELSVRQIRTASPNLAQLQRYFEKLIKYSSRDKSPYVCAAPTLRRDHLGLLAVGTSAQGGRGG
jgi:streptomycin 6-kinase